MRTLLAILVGALFIGTAAAASIPGADDSFAELPATPDGWYYYNVGFFEDPPYQAGDMYNGGEVMTVNTAIDFMNVRTAQPLTFQARATSDPDVRYVNADSADALVAHYTPNDPRIGEQWGWNPTPGIDGYGAWDVTMGTTGTVVAVLDTGLDKSHEDIGNYLQGYDFANGDTDPEDDCGHGTHVTGTVGALTDNGVGVAGTAQTTHLPVKVLKKGGIFGGCSGSFSDVANGITYAADQGADVISMSLGCNDCSDQGVIDAMEYAWSKGALIVSSAGNAGPCTNCVGFPANYDKAMAISALDSDGSLASYSSQGPEVELAAPGSNILSTVPGGYDSYSGTSMAAPHVSGTAALVLATGSMSNSNLRTHLKSTAVDTALNAEEEGAGNTNACNAVGSTTCGSGGGGGGGGSDGSMHVHDIAHQRKGSPRNGDLNIHVTIADSAETGVGSADTCVEVTDNGDGTKASGCGTTASDGTITFVWSGVGGGSYTTCVTGLTHASLTWDSTQDHASEGSCHTSSV